jgi:hypothetical protein
MEFDVFGAWGMGPGAWGDALRFALRAQYGVDR